MLPLGVLDTAAHNGPWIAGVALFGVLVTIGFVLLLPVVAQRRKPGPSVAPGSVALTAAPDPAATRPTVWVFTGMALVVAVASSLGSSADHHIRTFFVCLLPTAGFFIVSGIFFGLYRGLPDITYEELRAKKPWEQGQLGKVYFAAGQAPEFRRAGWWLLAIGGAGFVGSLLLKV